MDDCGKNEKESACILCAGNGCGEWKEQIRKIKRSQGTESLQNRWKRIQRLRVDAGGLKVAQEFGDLRAGYSLLKRMLIERGAMGQKKK